MNINWFKRFGLICVPASLMGWMLFLIGASYAVYSFIEIDSRSHSVSDTLMNFFFRLFLISCVYSAIAFLASRKS